VGEHVLTDRTLSIAAGEFAAGHPYFAKLCEILTTSYSFKTMPFAILLVALWFMPVRNGRRAVISAISGCFAALIVARLIQNLGPHRPRPAMILKDAFPDHVPFGTDWSSFPSDTTSAVIALTVGIFIGSRWFGAIALLWAAFIVAVPKLVTGAHYVSDLFAGGAIGLSATLLCYRASFLPAFNRGRMTGIPGRYPSLFYGLAFLLLFQLTTFFDDARHIGREGAKFFGVEQSKDDAHTPSYAASGTIADGAP
jgi:undecaprenyl-diphosphatase